MPCVLAYLHVYFLHRVYLAAFHNLSEDISLLSLCRCLKYWQIFPRVISLYEILFALKWRWKQNIFLSQSPRRTLDSRSGLTHAHNFNDLPTSMTLKSKMVDNFVLRYVRIYPGVNSRAELVTLAPGLLPELHLAPLAWGLVRKISIDGMYHSKILMSVSINPEIHV